MYTQLKKAIIAIFKKTKRRYSYRRVLAELCHLGWKVNHKLVYNLMDQIGLKYKVRAGKKYSSYQGQVSCIAENLLNRNFTPKEPNAVWVSDAAVTQG